MPASWWPTSAACSAAGSNKRWHLEDRLAYPPCRDGPQRPPCSARRLVRQQSQECTLRLSQLEHPRQLQQEQRFAGGGGPRLSAFMPEMPGGWRFPDEANQRDGEVCPWPRPATICRGQIENWAAPWPAGLGQPKPKICANQRSCSRLAAFPASVVDPEKPAPARFCGGHKQAGAPPSTRPGVGLSCSRPRR